MWVVGSGASHCIVGRQHLPEAELATLREAWTYSSIAAAAGVLDASQAAPTHVKAFGQSPSLLSVGHRCRWEAYKFVWDPFSDAPATHTSDGKVVRLLNIGGAPSLKEPIAESDASPGSRAQVVCMIQEAGVPVIDV